MVLRRRFVSWLALGLLLGSAACREQVGQEQAGREQAGPTAPSHVGAVLSSLPGARSAAPVPSEVVAFEKELRRSRLELPPRRQQLPQLAFARGSVARLTRDALVVLDARTFEELLHEPLEGPRALLTRADGGLLALGARTLVYWQPGWKRTKPLLRPMVLPGVELFADAQQADRLWIFDGQGSAELGSPKLIGYRLVEGEGPLVLPEQTIELQAPRGGVFGLTRAGVWLYAKDQKLERLAPSGLRLGEARLPELPAPAWLAPARRLDQALWVEESGQIFRSLVSPTFKRLGTGYGLPGRPLALTVGDGGQLVASVIVSGPGPSFELLLLNGELAPRARVPLPAEAPSDSEDWVPGVTENQALAAAAHEPRVAVGGPSRLLIFDGEGRQLFPKPSQ